MDKADKKTVGIITGISAFIAGLCCFSPIVLVLLGLATTSFAGGLADTFYGDYKWYFRGAGFLFILLSYFWWYKSKSEGCSLDQKKKLRNKTLNMFLITFIVTTIVYIIWLYGVVEYIGIKMDIWENPYTNVLK